jgi:tRNA (guanine37-N1)-methyltransferase
MTFRATVVTLFPELFPGPLGISIPGRAREAGLWSLELRNLRAFGLGPHRNVDDTPFGGGAGMVLRADVADAALAGTEDGRPAICLTPRGRRFDQARARALAAGPGAVVLCGRFEGIDQRLIEARDMEEVSLGDFVLAGGEVAAMALLEATIRLLPGAIAAESAAEESFSAEMRAGQTGTRQTGTGQTGTGQTGTGQTGTGQTGTGQTGTDQTGTGFLLEYPHYTRPAEWAGRAVPPVLLSGNHQAIAAWRREEAARTTRERRPDLWEARLADEMRGKHAR